MITKDNTQKTSIAKIPALIKLLANRATQICNYYLIKVGQSIQEHQNQKKSKENGRC